MPRPRKFEVAPDPMSGWKLTDRGRTVRVSSSKEPVVRSGIREARAASKSETAQLVIKKANGRIQEERTYPRKADPRRTKG
jgi:hypothetical protein